MKKITKKPFYKTGWKLALIAIVVAVIFGMPAYILLFKPQKVIIDKPTNVRKDNIKDNSPVQNQTNIGTIEGDYVGRDKNITNIYKPEVHSIKKIEQYPKHETLTINKASTGSLNFVNGEILLYVARFRWIGDEVLVLIKLPEEKEERAYRITDDTQLPFTIQINTHDQTCLMTIERKLTNGLQIRTFSELSPESK